MMPGTKKGFILTLDLMLGLVIFFMVLFSVLFFVNRQNEFTLADYQLLRTGSDLVTILDNQKRSDDLNPLSLESNLQDLVPANYGLLLRIQGEFDEGNGTIEVGDEIPLQKVILSGRRVALTDNEEYLLITYMVWSKEQ
ncbi:TPA: hypothetical protein HA234_06915 [Candidatus Woesearchaeota archaeon]|nr:hypothetical protein [Candidatus Woesearchaeota archaeon]